MRMSRGQPTMPWSDGLCQGQRYPSHREGGWMVIAVWLTLNVSADGTGLLERAARLAARPMLRGDFTLGDERMHPS